MKELEPNQTYTLECLVHGIIAALTGKEIMQKVDEHREEYGCYYEIKVYEGEEGGVKINKSSFHGLC